MPDTMRAAVFQDVHDIHIEEVGKPAPGPTDAVVKITTTTICGTDSHIWRGEYPVAKGRIVGHEPVGVIDQLGEAVRGFEVGERVVVGAITPCGACYFCQHGDFSQCAGYEDTWGMIGGWRLGNSMHGVQADYFLVPYAQANLCKIPDGLSDEEVVFVTDIATTGISAAETADVRIGDSVVVYAQGPIGLCATAGRPPQGRRPGHRRRLQPDPPGDGQEDGRRRGDRLHPGGPGRQGQGPHGRPRRGRGHRGAGHPGDLRELPGLGAPRRRRLVARRLRRQGVDPPRGVRLRHRRHRHPHDPLPGGQGAACGR